MRKNFVHSVLILRGFKQKNISLKTNFNKRKYVILGGVLLLLNVVFINLPLLNVVGYEFSVVNALLLYLFGGVISLSKEFPFSLKNMGKLIILILIPLAPGLLSNYLLSVCPLGDSIWFYIIISVPATFIGISTGIISRIVSLKYRILLFIFFTVMMVLSPLEELYFNPQVYFYNPVIAYYPGVIYDELISVDFKLIIYRVLNLFFFGGVVYYLLKSAQIRHKLMVLLTGLITVMLFSVAKPYFGLETDIARINSELVGVTQTEHFVIFHSDSLEAKEIESLKLEHEYYYGVLSREMGFEPSRITTSFVFETRESKKRLIGAGNAEVAKPWLGQIYIERSSIHSSLKHELVHVFSAEVGDGLLRLPEGFNPAMIEGYAMLYENDYRGERIYEMTALAKQKGFNIPIQSLFSGFNFFGSYSGLSYLYSGAFLKFIRENYGSDIVNKLYGETDFEKYTGKDITTLSDQFSSFIDSVEIDYNQNTANLHFGYKPLIKKICPRYLASELQAASELLISGDTSAALDKYDQLLVYSESYTVLRNYFNLLLKEGRVEKADSLLTERMERFRGTGYFYNTRLLKAKSFVYLDNLEDARSQLDSLIIENPNPGYVSAAKMMKIIIENEAIPREFWNYPDSLKEEKLLSYLEKGLYFGIVFEYLELVSKGWTEDQQVEFLEKQIHEYRDAITPQNLWVIANFYYYKFRYESAREYLIKVLNVTNNDTMKWKAEKLLRKLNRFVLMAEMSENG